jgi:DNA-binding NarL/FixJ family response regulator
MLSILIVDDHEVIRSGFKTLTAGLGWNIDEAADGMTACEKAARQHYDVILMDIRLPNVDGLNALAKIRLNNPEAKVVMLSTYDNPTYVARAMALGAAGYVQKDCGRDELVSAIRAVAAGETAWTPEQQQRMTKTPATPRLNADLKTPLTERECEVLKQLTLGLSNKEIAQALQISVETVKEHVQHILQKIDASDRTQAAVWAVRKGFV